MVSHHQRTNRDKTRTNVNRSWVEDRYHKNELKAISIAPIRFTAKAVDEVWKLFQPAREEDVPVREISNRISGDELRKTKYQKVRSMISIMGVQTYTRRGTVQMKIKGRKRAVRKLLQHVHEKQADRIVERIINPGEEIQPDAFTVTQARKKWKKPHAEMREAIDKYASDSGREIEVRRRRCGLHKITVYPQAAIEAALRGEFWTPSPTQAEADDKHISQTDSPRKTKPSKQKNKGGRPKGDRKRLDVESWLDKNEAQITPGSQNTVNVRLANAFNAKSQRNVTAAAVKSIRAERSRRHRS